MYSTEFTIIKLRNKEKLNTKVASTNDAAYVLNVRLSPYHHANS